MLRKTFLIFIMTLAVFYMPLSVPASGRDAGSAAEAISDEDWIENEITNTFYVPKSAFHSVYDYQEYCQRMYNNGYMDEYYNWTDEALDYISNPTKEKSEALDESAKALVEERVAEGRIAPEDNPFLTYEEREAIKSGVSVIPAAEEAEETETLETPAGTIASEKPETDVAEAAAPMEDETKEAEESREETEWGWDDTSGNSFGKFITAAIITLIVMLGYYFYRKRNN